jgi:hypothetical protein
MLTHGSPGLADNRRGAFSIVLVGNQIAESGAGSDGRTQHRWRRQNVRLWRAVRLIAAGPGGPHLITWCLAMSRSRSNMADVSRQPMRLRTSSSTPAAIARASVGWIALNASSMVTATDGRLAGMPSCWATRISLARVEIATPSQIDQPASSSVKISWRAGRCRAAAPAPPGPREELDAGQEQEIDRIRDRDRRDQHRQGLAQQELLAADRRGEHRLQRALLALADHREGGDGGGHQRRDGQQVEQLMTVCELAGCRGGHGEELDQRLEQEDEREDCHPPDN